MVYRISNFTENSLENIFKKVESDKRFNLFYKGGSIYIAYIKYLDYKKDSSKFKKFLKENNVFVEEISEDDICKFSQEEKDWINIQLVRLELQKYEFFHQERLKSISETIKQIDKSLSDKLEKEGGDLNGDGKNTR